LGFKNNKSGGINNIGPKILKEVCLDIANPYTHTHTHIYIYLVYHFLQKLFLIR